MARRATERLGARAAERSVARKQSKLCLVRDWEKRAQAAKWRAAALAAFCGVSVRQLRRFVWQTFGLKLSVWLNELRQKWAADHPLAEGKSVKETAAAAFYAHTGNFSRDFKHCFGHTPSSHCLYPRSTHPPAHLN